MINLSSIIINRMEQLELRVLKQVENYVSPFDHGTEGFNNRWWHDSRIDTIAEAEDCDTAYVQLLKDGIEIGRAEITRWDIRPAYVGINTHVRCRKIWYFEINSGFRRQGYGRKFTTLLVEKYSELPLLAFSKGADDFWAGIGWYFYPPKDKEETNPMKLFASREISN